MMMSFYCIICAIFTVPSGDKSIKTSLSSFVCPLTAVTFCGTEFRLMDRIEKYDIN